MQIQVFESVAALPSAIARQCAFPGVDNFFLSLDWFACLYETALHASVTPRIYCVLDDGEQVVAVLYGATRDGDRTLYSLTNFYTMEFAPVFVGGTGMSVDVVRHLADFLSAERPAWNAVDFRFLVEDAAGNAAVQTALRANGFSVGTFFMYENWSADTTGVDFDAFYAALPSRLRNTIKRREKKLNKAHGTRIEIFTEPGDALQQAIEDYVTVYNKSWKEPEPFPDFTPRLISLTAELGILRLGVLYVDDEPAAAQIWVNSKDGTLIYKLAYDEAFSEFSTGSILSRELFRHAIDVDNVREIDYGVGSENYKKDWMNSVRRLEGMQAYNTRTASGFWRAGQRSATAMVKRLLGR